jgi:hypothetical protein
MLQLSTPRNVQEVITQVKILMALHLAIDMIAEEEGLKEQCERIEMEFNSCELETTGIDPYLY